MVFELTISRLEGRRKRVESFIDKNLLQWVEQVGVPIVKKTATSRGLLGHAVDAIHAEKKGYLNVPIVWGLKTKDGEPLDLFLEKGTNSHDIEIRFKKVLSDGESIFGKKVRHPGTRALSIFKDSEPLVLDAVESKISSETSRFLDGMRIQ